MRVTEEYIRNTLDKMIYDSLNGEEVNPYGRKYSTNCITSNGKKKGRPRSTGLMVGRRMGRKFKISTSE